MQGDPAKDGANWYSYCGNNPIRYHDPTGLIYGSISPNDPAAQAKIDALNRYGAAYLAEKERQRTLMMNRGVYGFISLNDPAYQAKMDAMNKFAEYYGRIQEKINANMQRIRDTYLVPPDYYSPTGKWSYQDLLDFESCELGNKLIYSGCTPELMAALEKFRKECEARGWTIDMKNAYRPLIYQAHFYDISYGPNSTTARGRAERAGHELSSNVSYPNPTGNHTAGIAFDAIVYDQNGNALNSLGFVNSELRKVANECGLNVNIPGDYVHFQLK